VRDEFLSACDSETDFFEVYLRLNKSGLFASDFDAIVKKAEKIFEKYCIISHTINQNELKEKNLNKRKNVS
jgi:organic hydroperoxide reductase OsmC/OhrA